jgi:uncharacterized membrane-anchored protein
MSILRFFLLAAIMALTSVQAQEKLSEAPRTPEQKAAVHQSYMEKILADIVYQEGHISLLGGKAGFDLPSGYRFLNARDSKRVIVDLWENPPGYADGVLGMVVPRGEDLAYPDSWAIVVTYQEDGYVSDHDADAINYDDLLKEMRKANEGSNKEREKQGYASFVLKGWAVAPSYDHKTKALFWAREFLSSDTSRSSLNYDVRVLGRSGVLSLNGVAGMNRLKDIQAASSEIVSMVHFTQGNRYQDFSASTDKKADYTLAGLVLGGAIAAKTGLLKGLFVGLLAMKKLVVAGAVAVFAGIRKLFGRKKDEN